MNEKMKEIIHAIYGHLTDEQMEKAKACNNADELMKHCTIGLEKNGLQQMGN